MDCHTQRQSKPSGRNYLTSQTSISLPELFKIADCFSLATVPTRTNVSWTSESLEHFARPERE